VDIVQLAHSVGLYSIKMSVPTNEKDLSGRPGHLNETQQAAFDEFKSKVDSTHDQATRRWYDDTTLL
jgi:hypothetical protein